MLNNYELKLPSGIPTIESYNELLKSLLFLKMERFSNQFLELNKHALTEYSRKWVSDPLHQWSRQWEYPFVYTKIQEFIDDKKSSDIKILDAGSGITFFPYYLTSTLAHVKVDCCDIDASLLKSIFSEIIANSKFLVDFYSTDLHALPFKDDQYDIVYCISVLEHTGDFEIIIQEFKRILKQKGLLIMTFDISIDGSLGIPRQKAVELIEMLEKYFITKDFQSKQALKLLYDEDRILTTKYIRTIDKNLLPPRKYSLLSTFKNILKHRNSKDFENLTVFCGVLRNEYKALTIQRYNEYGEGKRDERRAIRKNKEI